MPPPPMARSDALPWLRAVAFTATLPVVTTREVAFLPIVASDELVSFTLDAAWFTATKPPVALVARALALVVVLLVIDSDPAVIDGPSAYARELGLSVMSAWLMSTPTKPPPEPLEFEDEFPSPWSGTIVVSGTPPGPVICWKPLTPPVMSTVSVWVDENGDRSATGVREWPGALGNRPVVSRWMATGVPAIASAF